LETIGIAAGALPIAILLGAPAALAIVRGGPLGRIVRAGAAVVRAIPELVLAIVFVVAIGFGPVPGTLALGLSGAATVARLYAELLESVRREPEEALRASGATATAAFLVGLLPTAWPGIVGFGAYAFESIMRAAVVVGVVGAGGLGAAMITSINLLDVPAFAAYVSALVVLVVVVDAVAGALRTRAPAWVAVAAFVAIAAVGVAAFAAAGPDAWTPFAGAFPRLIAYAGRAIPPDFSAHVLARIGRGVVETLAVAFVGTLVGAIAAIPFGLLAASIVAKGWMRGTGYRPWSFVTEPVTRFALAIARAVPPVALGLVAIAFVGLGPKAGAVALAIHTAGVLGKLFAESLELAELEPAESLVASGGTALAAVLVAIVPSAWPALTAHLLYRLEWNVRASTTLGIVGAGGIGQAIYEAEQLFHDRELSAYVVVATLLVLAADALTTAVRRGFAPRAPAR
jgi:phosphonate transport system permease protein